MSAHSIRVPVIYCDAFLPDGSRCMATHKAPPEITTVRPMRSHLRKLGWHTLRGGRDICPGCWREGYR